MEHYKKFLRLLPASTRKVLLETLAQLAAKDFTGLDIKKLKGMEGAYRVRKGKIRIIYLFDGRMVRIVDINYRKDAY